MFWPNAENTFTETTFSISQFVVRFCGHVCTVSDDCEWFYRMFCICVTWKPKIRERKREKIGNTKQIYGLESNIHSEFMWCLISFSWKFHLMPDRRNMRCILLSLRKWIFCQEKILLKNTRKERYSVLFLLLYLQSNNRKKIKKLKKNRFVYRLILFFFSSRLTTCCKFVTLCVFRVSTHQI